MNCNERIDLIIQFNKNLFQIWLNEIISYNNSFWNSEEIRFMKAKVHEYHLKKLIFQMGWRKSSGELVYDVQSAEIVNLAELSSSPRNYDIIVEDMKISLKGQHRVVFGRNEKIKNTINEGTIGDFDFLLSYNPIIILKTKINDAALTILSHDYVVNNCIRKNDGYVLKMPPKNDENYVSILTCNLVRTVHRVDMDLCKKDLIDWFVQQTEYVSSTPNIQLDV